MFSIGGRMIRMAWGSTMWRKVIQGVMPTASAASRWPLWIAWMPARKTSAM